MYDEPYPTSFISRVIDVALPDAAVGFDRYVGVCAALTPDQTLITLGDDLVITSRRAPDVWAGRRVCGVRQAQAVLRTRRGRALAAVSVDLAPWCCHRSELGLRLGHLAIGGLPTSWGPALNRWFGLRPGSAYFRFAHAAVDRVAAEITSWAAAAETTAAIISPDELQLVESALSAVAVDRGAVLMHEGSPGDDLMIIAEGCARVTRNVDDDARELAVLGRGAIVGEIALLHGTPRSATVTALTPMRAFVCDRDDIDQMSAALPALAGKIRSVALHRLRLNRTTAYPEVGDGACGVG